MALATVMAGTAALGVVSVDRMDPLGHARIWAQAAVLEPVLPDAASATPQSGPMPTTRDVPYGPDAAQRLDVYRPATSDVLPVVVWIHGGSWQVGSRTPVPAPVWRAVTQAQAVLVSVDYRMTSSSAPNWVPGMPIPAGTTRNAWPAPAQDVDRALRWLNEHAAEYRLDPSRMVVWGASAGAHLAMIAAVAPGVFLDPTLPPSSARAPSPRPAAYVAYSARSDFVATYRDTPAQAAGLRNLMGCATAPCDVLALALASPVTFLDASDPPGYLVCGRLDLIVPCATQAEAFVAQAQRLAAAASDTSPQSQPRHGEDNASVEVPVEEASGPRTVPLASLEEVNAGHSYGTEVLDAATFDAWLTKVLAPRCPPAAGTPPADMCEAFGTTNEGRRSGPRS